MDDEGDIYDSWYLILFEVSVQHDTAMGVDHTLFGQGEADPLRDGTDHLALHHSWIDDTAAIMGGDDPEDGDLAGLHIYLNLDALGAEGTHRFVLRVRPTGAMAQD